MDQDLLFVQSIFANPTDPIVRLVYADWLEERSDPRAEFMRLTVALLLGKNRQSPEVGRFREVMVEEPEEAEFDSDRAFFYIWKSKGISLRFEAGKLVTIHLYAQGADGYEQYLGDLPANLSFTDVRAEVEMKLGNPSLSGGAGVAPYWSEFQNQGVQVGYFSEDTEDLRNRIHHIGFFLPTTARPSKGASESIP